MDVNYIDWLNEHLQGAVARYEELCKLDDMEEASGSGSSYYYVQAQQMFGYVAALEKCLKQAQGAGFSIPTSASAPVEAAKPAAGAKKAGAPSKASDKSKGAAKAKPAAKKTSRH